MHALQATAASSLSLPSSTYIYAIAEAPTSAARQFGAISSDDSLRLFDGQSLQPLTVASAKAHEGVTALKSVRSVGNAPAFLATAGRDGAVRLWDIRSGHVSGKADVEMRVERDVPILSLACNPETHTIVAGTEIVSSQATVALWDIRSPGEKKQQYVESHNDDVTELQFHPTRHNVLLSGSTDGLVNLYDINIADEDDTLLQVINHGSIHHAGFLSEDVIFALSHDEVFSIHPVTNPDGEGSNDDPTPIQFGDLRNPLGCEYVVQTLNNSNGTYLAAGNTAEQRLDILPIVSNPKWDFDYNDFWRLPGAHGEEIVRAVHLDEQSQTVFSGGEDGFIRAWRPNASAGGENEVSMEEHDHTPRSKDKRRQRDEKRFKPY
ncbi:WD repeat protein [Talaromyces proteolyticus]|uniref:WD repeat protein n=1 Tax=Talaromyces proteolyticus TaxID=1131652 RepID=A0AAD4Q1K7_9EURO|nr:WD repeat protein [Talaromyces proteolyticus]KAH8698819.1 WD repeat protein [Talaromyces proteolyticus]